MQDFKPQITTIIPTYKRPKLLKRAIESVLKQSYENFQICIYDNASGDETEDIVKELAKRDTRIMYYCHDKNIGSNANFQYGVDRVTTPYFSLLSDDDYLLPWFFETALGHLENKPDCGFFAGGAININEKKKINTIYFNDKNAEGYFFPLESFFKIANGTFPVWTSFLFRKEAKDYVKGLDVQISYMDYDFLLRIASQFPIVISRKPCAIFLEHSASLSSSLKLKEVLISWEKMIKKFQENEKLKENEKIIIEMRLRKEMNKFLLMKIERFLKLQQFQGALEGLQLLDSCERIKVLIFKFIVLASKKMEFIYVFFKFLIFLRRILVSRLRIYKFEKKFGKLNDFITYY